MPQKTSCLPFYFYLTKKALNEYNILSILAQMESLYKNQEVFSARLFSEHINEFKKRKLEKNYISAGGVLSVSLLQEIYLTVLEKIQQDYASSLWEKTVKELKDKSLKELAQKYAQTYTPREVVLGILSEEEYSNNMVRNEKNQVGFYNDLLVLYLGNENPAMLEGFAEFYQDEALRQNSPYRQNIQHYLENFRQGPVFGKKKNDLYHFLREPIEASPKSLSGQLEYIFQNWREFLPEHLLLRILKVLDTIREEEIVRGQAGASLETVLPDYKNRELFPEYEAFTPDRDWMPNLVLIAKSTYVWLYQLSKQYQREIKTLNQIPDEELDKLARWGFTGLWLIGLWERSVASRRIKQLCGNLEAMSSAYSLYDYTIAQDLGGEEALEELKMRCARRGIRLAADMVPNHTGIYSRWIEEHPEYFLSLPYSPFPNYKFTGENLSPNPNLGIYIEDGYYSRSDAAVVFKRVDFRTGEVRYIYHGNDGTSTPWNDTAQIDYLNPEARERVIETIMKVAKKFPIIRFDAAMTLAKRHIQRLWHPEPGQGGAIPSRAEFSKTREEFNALMPKEFWREVVDRAAVEVPDTLLLAEAFWMMEGYFVRTLGMHRVYNSAFMNMLKKEENQKYRNLIKETLEFNPEILKRYVNFMSNPDEETAVAQFSKGDKYFGVCLMMVTMPGLPMFAHGQIEGFREKYGMEYGRSYWEEYPDEYLMARHEREIFPLLHKRYLFSGVEKFAFYDFITVAGHVDENVFAYSNMAFGERALIVYNNRYGDTAGYIKQAVRVNVSGKGNFVQKDLVEALELRAEARWFTIFCDHRTNLEYIRHNETLKNEGLFILLGAYGYHIFLNFREAYDSDGYLYELYKELGGRGVPSISEALEDLRLRPLLEELRQVINPEPIISLCQYFLSKDKKINLEFLKQKPLPFENFKREFNISLAKNYLEILQELLDNYALVEKIVFENEKKLYSKILQLIPKEVDHGYPIYRILAVFLLILSIFLSLEPIEPKDWVFYYQKGRFAQVIMRALKEIGARESEALWESQLLEVLLGFFSLAKSLPSGERELFLHEILSRETFKNFIQVHSYNGVLWFHKESFELFLTWLLWVSLWHFPKNQDKTLRNKLAKEIKQIFDAAEKSAYRFQEFCQLLGEKEKNTKRSKK